MNPLLQKGKVEKADWLNLILDLPMDFALSGIYGELFKGDDSLTKIIKDSTNGVIDCFIDVLQTQYIFNLASKIVEKQNDAADVKNTIL